jgi:chromosome segregation ATPase
LKEENESMTYQLVKMKDEIQQLEVSKSKVESTKAELDYNLRAQEYNVTLLKNQIENLTTEMTILKKQADKANQKVNFYKSNNDRMQTEMDQQKGRNGSQQRNKSFLPQNVPVLG